MLSPKNGLQIFLYVNILSWLLLLVIRLIVSLGFHAHLNFDTYFYVKGLVLNVYLLWIFFYFNAKIGENNQISFVEILNKLFFRGLLMTTFSLLIQVILTFIQSPPISESRANVINILYHFDIILVTIFLTQVFFYWKKLVLYQQTRVLQNVWNIFEYVLLISLLFNFFEFDLSHFPFTLAMGGLVALGFYLSLHLKWVAYLNAREKWQSIVLLLFIAVFSYYFFYSVISHSDIPYFTTDLLHSVFVLGMFVFVLFYSIFSLLVILFNLPTTSVFEQKFEEVISFQRLAEALQQEEKEEKVYEVLLDTALEAIDAESAWIEIKHNTKMELAFTVERNLKKEDVKKMISMILQERKKRVLEDAFQKKMNRPEEYILANYGYQSVLSVPLMVNENSIGNLMLLKKEKDAFDEEKRQLIHTFARQASISIENFRLLTRTIEAERYKEDLKIAQIVQEKLLPTDFALSDKYDISAFSKPAYEVGGDYYDVYSFKDKIIIIIGDVSGKGTKAAFHMAQMKGIFQTLAQMELDSKDFFKYANNALSRCLSKDTFITATLVSIDAKTDEVEIARAGHCPTLYCAKDAKKCVYLKAGGMGLGILRNQQYANSIQNENLYCNVDDVLLLYTDGLVEARNALGDEFGEERLEEILLANKHCSPTEINKKIKESLKDFRHETPIFDDYTAVVIKRKN